MTNGADALLDHVGEPLRLHHVGIVVGDLDAAVARYEALGFGSGERWDIPHQHVVAVTFPAGPGWVELIQPTDPEGPIARFHAKRGDGMHHIAYAVPDIDARPQTPRRRRRPPHRHSNPAPAPTAGASPSSTRRAATAC